MRILTTRAFVLLVMLSFATPATTQAAADTAVRPDESGEGISSPAPATAGPQGNAPRWKWRRANGWIYGGIGIAAAASLYLEYDEGDPKGPHWSSRNDFDEAVRNVLRPGGISDRRVASHASDAIMGVMIAAPEVDAFATVAYRDRDWDTFYQTSAINLESFTFTSFISVLLQTQVARERPFVRNCVNGQCESDQIYRSMPSGHAAYAFTGAGLICTHHEFQHNYRDPGLEGAVCAAALGLASVEGVARIVADGHYATDVLAGTAIGLFSGFLLPRLLHYWHPAAAEASAEQKGHEPQNHFVLTPTVLQGSGAGLAWLYRF